MLKHQYASAIIVMAALIAVGGFASIAARESSHGVTYYVGPSGSDTNAGTSINSPFQHIQKCAQTMVAGDTCEIESGIYHETVRPADSGTPSARITYIAAPGADVIIDGADVVTGWSLVSSADVSALESGDKYLAGSGFPSAVAAGHVYKTSVILNPRLPGNQIFNNGRPQIEAQWPYPGTNPLNPHFEWAQTGTKTSVSDSALTKPPGFWNGALLFVSSWFYSETGTVTRSRVGSVTASGLACHPWPSFDPTISRTATHYFLLGKIEELIHPSEWLYDSGSHELYVWTSDSGDPSSEVIEAKQRNLAVDLSGISYTSVLGIGVHGATIQTSSRSSGDILDGITARYVSAYDSLTAESNSAGSHARCVDIAAGETSSGIILAGTGNVLRNSSIYWSAGNGVVVSGSGNTVSNNVIQNVDYMGTLAAGINLIGSNQTITHNTISGAGRSDINIDSRFVGSKSTGNRVAYNDLSHYAKVNVDGGAIYACCRINLKGSSFDHNLLHDAAPPAKDAGDYSEAGIYLDNGTHDATLYDNVGWNNPTGTIMINPWGHPVANDYVYNNTDAYGPGQGWAVLLFPNGFSKNHFLNTHVENNIGYVSVEPSAVEAHNLSGEINPLFINPSAHNYALRQTSPARRSGAVSSPATNGYVDSTPSEGAYQYGVPAWTAGAVDKRGKKASSGD